MGEEFVWQEEFYRNQEERGFKRTTPYREDEPVNEGLAQIMNSVLKKVGKTTRPFRYDLNQIPMTIYGK